jgi:hypothetical protein
MSDNDNEQVIRETEELLKELKKARELPTTRELLITFVDWLNENQHLDESDLLKLAAASVQRKEKSKEEGLELFKKAWESVS